jgi:hypothetical protein
VKWSYSYLTSSGNFPTLLKGIQAKVQKELRYYSVHGENIGIDISDIVTNSR